MPESHELREVADAAARLGGRILQDWRAKFTAREKSPKNLVTEADLASQHAILEFLLAHYPDHQFLGEEDLCRAGSAPYRWIIDPLDGTSNYVHGFPYYAVSIAVEHHGELVAGAVYDPNRDEMFTAARGAGATRNGERIEVSTPRELSQALCMASLPMKAQRTDLQVQRFLKLLEAAQHVQRTGSAALNLCGVACGRIDAFWSNSLMPWDMAAGVLLVREAGGRVTTTAGGTFDVNVADLLTSNGPPLHDAVAAVLR
ncbi:MAG: inositol monophosphatase [Planctomycetaceae bacterium]|nr:inositol monophosphatase [Planctomycetaceae bacterium]